MTSKDDIMGLVSLKVPSSMGWGNGGGGGGDRVGSGETLSTREGTTQHTGPPSPSVLSELLATA